MPLPYEPDNDRFEPYDRYRSGNLRLSRYFDLGAGGPEPAWELGVMTARGEAHVACGAGHDPTDIAHNLRDIERRGASRPLPERAAVERILATVGLFDAAAINDVQGARNWLE